MGLVIAGLNCKIIKINYIARLLTFMNLTVNKNKKSLP